MAIMTHQIPFMKMHGLGNDFVIVDSRDHGPKISAKIAQGLGDRHRGVGLTSWQSYMIRAMQMLL